MVLKQLARTSEKMIDLEALTNHKGSAFGAIGEAPQPGQEMFENVLANKLFFNAEEAGNQSIWLEDESQRIGSVNIPLALWNAMRSSPIYFLDISFGERLLYLVETYGKFDREKLVGSVMRIQKRLGGLETKNAINFLLENNVTESFRILLNYYDKLYAKGLHNRENLETLLIKLDCETVDAEANADQLKQVLYAAKTRKEYQS